MHLDLLLNTEEGNISYEQELSYHKEIARNLRTL